MGANENGPVTMPANRDVKGVGVARVNQKRGGVVARRPPALSQLSEITANLHN